MKPKSFLYEEKDGIARITLNRPEKLNAINFEVYRELRDIFAVLGDREEVRVVVITGAGRGFCSGGDVNEIIPELFRQDTRGLLEYNRMTESVTRNLRGLLKPVIASINGVAAGAGAALALACDFRIASENARFAFLFTQVGLAGADMGVCWLLPRVVGLGRATELLMLGNMVSAQDAQRYGLVNKVVKPEELEAETMKLAESLVSKPPFALAMTKQILNYASGVDLQSAIEAEIQAQTLCMETRDFREAYEAFTQKRQPRFQGR